MDRVFKSSSKNAKNKRHQAISHQAKAPGTQYSKGKSVQCHKCGSSPSHPTCDCPANEVKCHSCGKKGHYKHVCKASRAVLEVEEDEDAMFLGSVTTDSEPWMVDIDINDKSVLFKIDAGADVTVVPNTVFDEIYRDSSPPTLQKAIMPLLGPGRSPLDVVGVMELLLRKGEKEVMEDVYVTRRLHTVLLGRPASVKLKLVARLDSITMETLKTSYPKLCSGLGEVRQPYAIKLKPGAQPSSKNCPAWKAWE